MALYLDPEAVDQLERLYASADRGSATLADRIDGWLDRLERDHTTSAVRRHRLRAPRLWAIVVEVDEGADWVILWETDGDDVVVRYIGPASFA